MNNRNGLSLDELLLATLDEDLGDVGDLTSLATVGEDAMLDMVYVTRDPGVVAGLRPLARLVELAAPTASLSLLTEDGARIASQQDLATLSGPARALLALERASLNLLSHLSGIATHTRAWADALDGTRAKVRDTRKTLPMLRELEKYAVRCGGGTNHRTGLYDAILIKDNHILAAGGVKAALEATARLALPDGFVVQVEVDDFAQLEQALDSGAKAILLDNFDVPSLGKAVRRIRSVAPSTVIEASGKLTLEAARAVAATGVDYLAVGALTHSSSSLDIGLDARERERVVGRRRT